jgi:hypothetical protein
MPRCCCAAVRGVDDARARPCGSRTAALAVGSSGEGVQEPIVQAPSPADLQAHELVRSDLRRGDSSHTPILHDAMVVRALGRAVPACRERGLLQPAPAGSLDLGPAYHTAVQVGRVQRALAAARRHGGAVPGCEQVRTGEPAARSLLVRVFWRPIWARVAQAVEIGGRRVV